MSASYIWAVIGLMAVANFAVRYPPIALVSRIDLPGPVMRWFGFIPAAVMGALVAGEVLRPGGEYLITPESPYILAAIPTALVYHYTRSFLGATVTGMAIFVAARSLLG